MLNLNAKWADNQVMCDTLWKSKEVGSQRPNSVWGLLTTKCVLCARARKTSGEIELSTLYISVSTVTGICKFGAFSAEEDQRVFWHQF